MLDIHCGPAAFKRLCCCATIVTVHTLRVILHPPDAQDEEERQLAVTLLASAGDKKTRADRQRERKERKEAGRRGAQVCLWGSGSGHFG